MSKSLFAKHIFPVSSLFMLCAAASSGESGNLMKPIANFYLRSGALNVRFDGAKYDNPNRIEYKGMLLSVDTPQNHFGTVLKFQGADGFAGTGHIETGVKEQIFTLSVNVDGSVCLPKENEILSGSEIVFRKTSSIDNVKVETVLILENDKMAETVSISSPIPRKMDRIYAVMHPWSPNFKMLFYPDKNNKWQRRDFRGDGKFAVKGTCGKAVWYDPERKTGIISLILPGEGNHKIRRLIWDRPVYRKDYLGDYFKAELPGGGKLICRMATGFFLSAPDKVLKQAEICEAELREWIRRKAAK